MQENAHELSLESLSSEWFLRLSLVFHSKKAMVNWKFNSQEGFPLRPNSFFFFFFFMASLRFWPTESCFREDCWKLREVYSVWLGGCLRKPVPLIGGVHKLCPREITKEAHKNMGDRGRKIMGGGEVMQVVSPEIEELGRVNPPGGVSNKPTVQTKWN